MNKDSKR